MTWTLPTFILLASLPAFWQALNTLAEAVDALQTYHNTRKAK
ncbi:hypothetical protein [Rothia nasimurium]|nr:hypothetical protein [Rothia nasimurium]